jgi:hypothetical protein
MVRGEMFVDRMAGVALSQAAGERSQPVMRISNYCAANACDTNGSEWPQIAANSWP